MEGSPEPQAEVPLSQGAVKALGAIQKFIGLEAAQTRAVQRRSSVLVDAQPGGAIADTFPSVTVLFSDVVRGALRVVLRVHRACHLTHSKNGHCPSRRRASRSGPQASLPTSSSASWAPCSQSSTRSRTA
jgi:hypothetical protein